LSADLKSYLVSEKRIWISTQTARPFPNLYFLRNGTDIQLFI